MMEIPLTKDNIRTIVLPVLAKQNLYLKDDECDIALIINIEFTRPSYNHGNDGEVVWVERDNPFVWHIHKLRDGTFSRQRSCEVMNKDGSEFGCFTLCDMSKPRNKKLYEEFVTAAMLEKL